jgi:multiple sugar transport system substrate-binding protein
VPTFQGLSNQFNRTHPNAHATFQLAPGSWETFNQKLVAEIAANAVPDVIRHAIIYRPELITAGYVLDLMPYAQKSRFPFETYYKAPFNGYLTPQHLWGVPVGIYTMAMYYNKTMFKEAGIPLPPTDWTKGYDFDQLLAVARKLTKGSGPTKQYGLQMFTDLRWWIQFIWQSGGDFLSPGYRNVTLGSPGAQQALQFLHDLMFKYNVWPNPESLKDYGTLTGGFTSGRVGMYLDGNWVMPTMKTIKNFEWGVAPLPHNTHVYTGYYIDGWFVPTGAPHPDLSWELIASFLGTEAEDFVVHRSDLGIPMLKSVAQKDANILFNPLPPAEQQVWLDSPNHGHLFPYSPIYNQLDPIISRNMDLFALQQVTPKQFAANLSAQIDPLLAKLTPAQRTA